MCSYSSRGQLRWDKEGGEGRGVPQQQVAACSSLRDRELSPHRARSRTLHSEGTEPGCVQPAPAPLGGGPQHINEAHQAREHQNSLKKWEK